jgi:membrane-bound serine protease (ClpP class)
MAAARLILAIVSTAATEAGLYAIWRWVLPDFDIKIPAVVLIVVMVGWAVFAVFDFRFVTQTLKKQALIGLPTMIGTRGRVARPLSPQGQIIIQGEIWSAEAIDGNIDSGEVAVVGQDGLKLIVRRENKQV